MDTTKKKPTPEEKVSILEERLKKARNVVSKKKRNQRNGWIVSAGIALEAKYKGFTETEQGKREMIRNWVDALDAGDERNRTRFLEFLDQLDTEKQPTTTPKHEDEQQSSNSGLI